MQLSPMGDNYSPPEDASQNQNYQQLIFAIPRRILPCLHIRLRWLTHPYVLANAGGCVRRCRRVCKTTISFDNYPRLSNEIFLRLFTNSSQTYIFINNTPRH